MCCFWLAQGKENTTTTRADPSQKHTGAQTNIKNFKKVLKEEKKKKKGKEHTMVLHSMYVR